MDAEKSKAITSRIHVVHIVNSLEPGGLENGVVNIANRLDQNRFKTSIICMTTIGEFAKRLSADVEVFCLERPDRFDISTFRKLATLLGEVKPDILHTHNLSPMLYGVVALFLSGWKCAVLQGEHGVLPDADNTFKLRSIRKLLFRRCNFVHCVSHSLRDEMQAFGVPESKLRVTINGVDCERYAPASSSIIDAKRNELGVAKDAMILGIIGRFVASKRHTMLIEAFETVANSQSKLHLLLVGDHGDEKDKILEMIDSSPFRDRIVWTGFQINPLPFIQVMDLLVIPSDKEGLSNAMLESMACGVPCLSHSACGAAEVIQNGRNGFLKEITDADALAAIIEQLCSDRERLQRIGCEANSDVTKLYSLESMVDTYADLYLEMAVKTA